MTTQISHGIGEGRLGCMETILKAGGELSRSAESDLIAEVRRLKQREADLLTALTLQEDLNKGLQKDLAAEVSHPAPETITGPSWTNVQVCECGHGPDDHNHKTLRCSACDCSCYDSGESDYARGLRV